jgi:hypothetical protein
MKELDRKDPPEVTGGTVGPVAIPIGPVGPLPVPGPDFPPNPLGTEQPAIEKYRA